jgi:quercetin dioxygenase-like cupin family protein
MISPKGWEESGQRPEFHEYTLVLKGELSVQTENELFKIRPGQAIVTEPGEWIKYDTLKSDTEYIAVCIPAFSMEDVHRDKDR